MNTETIEHLPAETAPREAATMPGFTSNANWELAQRIGKAFAASSLVPAQYQNNVANCIVALEMANRMQASPLMVMQNLYIVHGQPGWSSKFLIACFNQCGRFSSLRYEWNADRSGCRAWAVERSTGERIEGPLVTTQMAKDEGWSTKTGSKWKTMPELMLMYRAAAFLIRTYAPEISMGLRTDDEIIDIEGHDISPRQAKAAEVSAMLSGKPLQHDAGQPSHLPDLLKKIDACADAEIAALVLDDAREVLDDTEHAALVDAYDRRWKP